MTREEALLLVGGYATKTLTPAEREALFQAALDDQEVFDALLREQPLRELLEDTVSRQAILQALEKPRAAWFRSPWAWIPAAAIAAACMAILLYPVRKAPPPPPRLTAQVAVPAPTPRDQVSPEAPKMKQEQAHTRAAAAAPAPRAAPPAIWERPMAGVAGGASYGSGSTQGASLQPGTAAFLTSVLRENAAGEFEPLGTEPLRPGDRLRVEITPPVSGNVSLFRRDAAGERTLISTVSATAGQKIQMPPDAFIAVDGDATLEISLHPESGTAQSVVIPLRPE